MNAQNRAVFTAGPSRELINHAPRHWTQRAAENERRWREQIKAERARIVTDTEELSRL